MDLARFPLEDVHRRLVAIGGALDDGCTPNMYAHELGDNFDLRHAMGGRGPADPTPDRPVWSATVTP